MVRIAFFLFVLIGLLVNVACRNANRLHENEQEVSVTKNVLTVEPLDESGLKKLVAERRGRILLLNIWATWCAPCVAEFPDLAKISQSYDTTAVEVVAISADFQDEVDSKIIPFLRSRNVPFRVFVAQFLHQEDFINAVNRSWSGALPASLIYDARGKERLFHVGQQSFDDFKREIDNIKGGL
jgi:thiol-disulfide isomerase/thioredoxin